MAETKIRTGQILASSEAWTSWTPTWTNLTVGNGTLNVAKYKQVGKTVHYRVRFTIGSTTSVGAAPNFTIPVTAAADYNASASDPVGIGNLLDNGNNQYPAMVLLNTTTTFQFRPFNSASTYAASGTSTQSTVPFTWGTNDVISISGTYEAA
jgi:hypothetical protein